MADEIRVSSTIQIRKGSLVHVPQPSSFTADIVGEAKGPSPGAISVSPTGTDVDLNEIENPGVCWIQNLDQDEADGGSGNYITYGIWDPELSRFYPLGEILPGEFYFLRLSRFIQEEVGTGTGTVGGSSSNRLRLYSNASEINARVEVFER